MNQILKVLTGSRAHGLDTPTSDYDWRFIYVQPTDEMLGLDSADKFKPGGDGGVEGWEIGHFSRMALKCNPSILEALVAPPETSTFYGEELRNLFPKFLSAKYVRDAYRGFALSQKKAVLHRDVEPKRINKFLSHYLRVLWCGKNLLATGELLVNIAGTPIELAAKDAKHGRLDVAEGLHMGEMLEELIETIDTKIPEKPDTVSINAFLTKVRLHHLSYESVGIARDGVIKKLVMGYK